MVARSYHGLYRPKNNKALVFHNIWGLRTIDEMKRLIIGKSVITTLKPGYELSTIDRSFNFS